MKKYFTFLMCFMVLGIMQADNKSVMPESRQVRRINEKKSFVFVNLKIIFSGLVSEVQGKLNGSKLYKGRNNFIMSNKVKPKNPNTTSQATVRAGLREYAAQWAGLTDVQRAAWNEGGKVLARKNKLGTSHGSAGFNFYVAENQRNQLVLPGSASVVSPLPSSTGLALLNCSNLVATNTPATLIALDVPAILPNQSLVIYMTYSVSAGRSFVKGLYRPVAVLTTHAARPAYDITAQYESVFGAPISGRRIFAQWETVQNNSSKIDKFYGTTSAQIIVG
jgi:hypothetical protein